MAEAGEAVERRAAAAAEAALRPQRTPRRELGASDSPILRAMTGRAAPMHILMAELVIGAVIVGIRAVADYEVKTTGTLEGTIGHPKGQYGPFPILVGLLGTFFLLSFLAVGASGGKARATVAVAAGAVVDLALAMKSITEIKKVAATFRWQLRDRRHGIPGPDSSRDIQARRRDVAGELGGINLRVRGQGRRGQPGAQRDVTASHSSAGASAHTRRSSTPRPGERRRRRPGRAPALGARRWPFVNAP